MTLVLNRTRVLAGRCELGMGLCARSIKPLEGSRLWLRRTRALWGLNGRRERCGVSPRLCGRAGEKTRGVDYGKRASWKPR